MQAPTALLHPSPLFTHSDLTRLVEGGGSQQEEGEGVAESAPGNGVHQGCTHTERGPGSVRSCKQFPCMPPRKAPTRPIPHSPVLAAVHAVLVMQAGLTVPSPHLRAVGMKYTGAEDTRLQLEARRLQQRPAPADGSVVIPAALKAALAALQAAIAPKHCSTRLIALLLR